tara:strand:+ start:2596 stop:3135 length:540 start_codon:yes stop_codon:yes gene_type:complete
MICLFFISGSRFNKRIPYNKEYINLIKKLGIDLFVVKKLDYLEIKEKYIKYKKYCEKKFTKPIIGIMGISSGGYYANKLNNRFRNDFCILISPILDPNLRVKLTKKYAKPNIRLTKLKKVKDNTLIFLAEKDKKAPFEMYRKYKISKLITLKNSGHEICLKPNTIIKNKIITLVKVLNS